MKSTLEKPSDSTEAKAPAGGDSVQEIVRLWEIDNEDLTDEQLSEIITERYAPSMVPPCRVCGAPLSIGSCGGGQPTQWVCSVAAESRPTDWDHYGKSGWEDRRQGGDGRVMELLRRYLSNDQGEKSPAK